MNKVQIFYDSKCGPCQQLLQKVKPLKNIRVEKIHIDSNPSLVRDLAIKAIPTIIVYNESNDKIKEFVGYSTKLIETLKEY